MSKPSKNAQPGRESTKSTARASRRRGETASNGGLPADYWNACEFARNRQYRKARAAYTRLLQPAAKANSRLRVLIQNDLAVLAAMEGKLDEACQGWRAAIESNSECLQARLNLCLVEAELSLSSSSASPAEPKILPTLEADESVALDPARLACPPSSNASPQSPVRIALLSFLFNWPSTGGGNMHTAGLVEFLSRAGYDVRHFYARYPAWGIGRVAGDDYLRGSARETFGRDNGGVGDPRRTGETGGAGEETFGRDTGGVGDLRRTASSHAIEFADSEWNVATIRERFRSVVDSFAPDYVVISDTWNMKPHLAEAMRGYPNLLMVQAQECLCPLNNLRLLGIGPIQVEQCPRNQLATPQICHHCLAERGHHSGALHQLERALAGVGTPEYDRILHQSFYDAEAVLVLNPITAAMLEPYSRRVCIVPWGIDPARFPWSVTDEANEDALEKSAGGHPAAKLFMASVTGEFIKGFHVAHEACRLLRETRSDFELVVTFDPPGPIDEFTRSVGWCSQVELPEHYHAADICLVPTIAQDALSITSVEAMAAGIPVIASRIGGLPYTVNDGVTGLLCEPGNPTDLAEKIARLLDDPPLRRQMGLAGRRRFEEDFTWEKVIEKYWRPLLPQRACALPIAD